MASIAKQLQKQVLPLPQTAMREAVMFIQRQVNKLVRADEQTRPNDWLYRVNNFGSSFSSAFSKIAG